MEHLLFSLYEALGLELDLEEPTLLIDGELSVHFDTSDQGLEMICPLGPLPQDLASLRRALQRNYASPVTLATDADGEVLLALLRVEDGHSGAELLAALERLVQEARQAQHELALTH